MLCSPEPCHKIGLLYDFVVFIATFEQCEWQNMQKNMHFNNVITMYPCNQLLTSYLQKMTSYLHIKINNKIKTESAISEQINW